MSSRGGEEKGALVRPPALLASTHCLVFACHPLKAAPLRWRTRTCPMPPPPLLDTLVSTCPTLEWRTDHSGGTGEFPAGNRQNPALESTALRPLSPTTPPVPLPTLPLLHRALLGLHAFIIGLSLWLIIWVVILAEVCMGQCLSCTDPLVTVQHQHPSKKVYSCRRGSGDWGELHVQGQVWSPA